MKLDLKLLKKLCLITSPSRNEHPMISFIINYCYNIPNLTFEIDHYNNLFITKNTTNPEYYSCMIAHLDQIVTSKGPYGISVHAGLITGYHKVDKSPCSLGLDDKAGVCIALQLLKELPDLKVIFTTEEEMGAIGAREAAANIDFLSNIRYFLQADRKGNSDFITHTNGIDVSSSEFIKRLTPIMQKYDYKQAVGTLTDVGEFCEELGISGCNLSCGYYLAHTSKEYGIIADIQKCLDLVEEILTTVVEDKTYTLEVKKSWYSKNYNYEDDPYGIYNEYGDYDFDWKPDESAWEKYNSACEKAENEFPKELNPDEIPCDYCKDMDCMHCPYINVI